jgi:hypothetical protein
VSARGTQARPLAANQERLFETILKRTSGRELGKSEVLDGLLDGCSPEQLPEPWSSRKDLGRGDQIPSPAFIQHQELTALPSTTAREVVKVQYRERIG